MHVKKTLVFLTAAPPWPVRVANSTRSARSEAEKPGHRSAGDAARLRHRVALSNDRLIEHRDGHVRFRWKDYADHDRVKILTLTAIEFLRRFLLPIVPRGFMRIRPFGLLANRTRRPTPTRCRRLLGQPPPTDAPSESVAELMHRLTGIDPTRCPVCGEGRMRVTVIAVHATPPPDTS